MTASDFASLGLSEHLLRALQARNYTTPTPIQARSIPHLLAGKDLLGIAQTGTGKTAAFALPMLQLLAKDPVRPRARMPRALVLAPTRELASQIAEACEAYGKHLRLHVAIVFGGVGQTPQVQALQRGVDILVATPGRLLDLIKQRHCDLADVEILVLDEADRMLDMGFLPDVKRILATMSEHRQSLLFSATMPPDITDLAHKFLVDPVRVEVTPPARTADRIEQSVWFVEKADKRDLLAELLDDPQLVRTLVFTRTKHGADRVVRHLKKAGIHAHGIHGDKSQNQRERALDDFRDGRCHVLVATDIAARGIDVKDITHVVNFDLPNIPESYVHRIGRTARAGRDGIAISFCDHEEREYLRDIEKTIRLRIPVAGTWRKSGGAIERAQRSDEPRPAREAFGEELPRPEPKPEPQPKRPAHPHRQPQQRGQRPAPGKRPHNPWEQDRRQGGQQGSGGRDDRRDDRRSQDGRGQGPAPKPHPHQRPGSAPQRGPKRGQQKRRGRPASSTGYGNRAPAGW